MSKTTTLHALGIGAMLALGACDGTSGTLDISGDWTENWSCTETCPGADPETITGTVDLTMTQNGDQVTREDDDGTTWTGTLDGNEVTLSTEELDYVEESTFTFTPETGKATAFTIESDYTYAVEGGSCTGHCTGTGERR